MTPAILAYALLPALCLVAGFIAGWKLKSVQVRYIEQVREAEVEAEDKRRVENTPRNFYA